MAKKKNENEQPKAAEVEKGSVESQKTESEKTQENHHRVAVTTTEGNTIDKIRIFQEDNATKVQADYGKLKPDAETTEEKRAGMRTLLSRELSPEQAKEYQRLYADDPAKAKEYAVKSAYPMHVDDAKFHQKDTEINGRKVNYIVLEKLDAEKLNENSKHLAGQWQLSFGEKGNTDSRFFGLLNKEELASIRHRAEVTLDEHDQVKNVGKPLTMADIAAKVENRVVAQRLVNEKKLADAQKVDWSKFKLPSAANITGLHFSGVKDNPDRVWLKGKVNGIDVIGMLSKNETTAVRNKFATLEQAAAANKDFRNKVLDIVGPGQKQEVNAKEDAAVKAIIDRASDSSARSFTSDQVKTLNDFASGAETPEEREKVFEGLWEKAASQLKADGVNEAWQKDAHEELNDLAQGAVRAEQQGIKR